MALPHIATRYAFFTGKGGVGKTSLSCAIGLALAGAGRKVLIVSTDPASNLDEVMETKLGNTPTPINGAEGLFALNIDPEQAARDYRERMVGPYRGKLPAAAIASIEEQFSGACTVEIAAFNEFSLLLGDETTTAQFDHIIFDTAPTGHTLRLLTLPSAWTEFIASSNGGASCLGPLAGLEQSQHLYAATVAKLADPALTTVVLVARAQVSALREAERTRHRAFRTGCRKHAGRSTAVFKAARSGDAIADAMTEQGVQALSGIPAGLAGLERSETPFLPKGTTGLAALRGMIASTSETAPVAASPTDVPSLPKGLTPLIDDLARAGHGVIMTMGKGGVGKTAVAAAIAVALAHRGYPVHIVDDRPRRPCCQRIGTPFPT